jgi:tetratricopeptide (TPR) repeat protein
MRAGRDYAKLTGDTSFQVLTLVRFGRFDEVLEVTNRPKGEIQGALWDFATGYAQLRQGQTDFARVYLQRAKHTAETSKAMVRVHTAKDLVGIVAGILEGEIFRTEGNLPKAIASFESAVALQEGLTYDEPEPLPFHAAHWLGAALLEVKRYADAEQAYRKELQDHPHNGWSLLGLQQALAGQGKSSTEVDADLKASWSRSDTWTRSSRF